MSIPITIHQPRYWTRAVSGILASPLFLFVPGPGLGALKVVGAFVFMVVPVWVEAVRGTRTARIVPYKGKVEVSWRTAFFTQCHAEFPLSQFSSIVSYTLPQTRGGGWNCVDLLTIGGMHSLRLVSYSARYAPADFLTLVRQFEERDEARSIREEVANATGLKDDGFVGNIVPKPPLVLFPA